MLLGNIVGGVLLAWQTATVVPRQYGPLDIVWRLVVIYVSVEVARAPAPLGYLGHERFVPSLLRQELQCGLMVFGRLAHVGLLGHAILLLVPLEFVLCLWGSFCRILRSLFFLLYHYFSDVLAVFLYIDGAVSFSEQILG